jgi:hypothetical protein
VYGVDVGLGGGRREGGAFLAVGHGDAQDT